jgi:hypothetical protein
VQDKRNLYHQILRLPALKFCQLLCERYISHESLPITTNQYSPIEYLVIKHQLEFNEVNALLSYVPGLRRLSLNYTSSSSGREIVSSLIVLNHLTHAYLKISDFTFYQVESMMKNLFHSVQVLFISICARNDGRYLDANRWKQLILTSLPYLRIFDIAFLIHDDLRSGNNIYQCWNQIDEFNSSFWIERQWFFEHAVYANRDGNYHYLFSRNPYR